MRKIALLGSTGSIGTQALDVAARHADRFQIIALTAHSSAEKLFAQERLTRQGDTMPIVVRERRDLRHKTVKAVYIELSVPDMLHQDVLG